MNNSFFTAFLGTKRLSTGTLPEVLAAAFPHREGLGPALLIFAHDSGRQLDFDWRGTLEEVVQRTLPPAPKTGPGRPKLGVVSTEVTLLPRHWDWLNQQPARASGTLRRLVEDAMAREATDPLKRREALGKILWAVAGNEPGFEEAARALYAGDGAKLKALSAGWSGDLPEFVENWS